MRNCTPPKSRLPGSVNNFLRIIKIIQSMRYKIYEITESCVKKKKIMTCQLLKLIDSENN